MKNLFTIALLTISSLVSAQPGHHKNNHNPKKHKPKEIHNHRKPKKNFKHNKKHPNYDYRVQRELERYRFLNLSNTQRNKLQVSINFLVTNSYNEREYERRLRSDLHQILTQNQYRNWENRAYNSNNNNVFIFNFNG